MVEPLRVERHHEALQAVELVVADDAVPGGPTVDRRPGDVTDGAEAEITLPLQILEAIPREGGEFRQFRPGEERRGWRLAFRGVLLGEVEQELEAITPLEVPVERL